jgi:hypothetical protein
MKNKNIIFIEGAAESKNKIHGKLFGIAETGALQIQSGSVKEFLTGELQYLPE